MKKRVTAATKSICVNYNGVTSQKVGRFLFRETSCDRWGAEERVGVVRLAGICIKGV